MDILKKVNPLLCILPLLLFSLSYITLLSTSVQRANTQLVFFILGYAIFLFISYLDYGILGYVSKYLYWISLGFLALVFLLGEVKLGSARWLSIGGFTFQPSELVKFCLVICLSFELSQDNRIFSSVKRIFLLGIKYAPFVVLILLQPDLGSGIVVGATFLSIVFMAGLPIIYFVLLGIAVGFLSGPVWNLMHDYQRYRILVFLNPELDVLGKGYNVIQSLIAVGSGGLWGKGFGRGTQAHLNFLPIHWTDFIFASFAEEWGFIGVTLLIILFVSLFVVLLRVMFKSSDSFGYLLTVGVFFIMLIQFFINVGMNLGIMPVTGITLPFISYGGTSLVITLALLGVAHSVWIHRL